MSAVGASSDADTRIERLSAVSLQKVIEPDAEVPGSIGTGSVLPPHLLSVDGLGLSLTPKQLEDLSREELASVTAIQIRFEAAVMAAFNARIATAKRLDDPRVTYALHEIGEETRHSRLFVRLLGQLEARAKEPLPARLLLWGRLRALKMVLGRDTLMDVFVLAGEEITDLMQKEAAEDPSTDRFVAEVNRYHRQEEARHVAFARTLLPEDWARAGRLDRFLVRRVAPLMMAGLFAALVHPGVYATVGLPAWPTWRAVNQSAHRLRLRHEGTRPVLAILRASGVFRAGRVPRAWRDLCGVDASGRPVEGTDARTR